MIYLDELSLHQDRTFSIVNNMLACGPFRKFWKYFKCSTE